VSPERQRNGGQVLRLVTRPEGEPVPTLIYPTPEYVQQTRANSCWYACLKMFKAFHTGGRHINNAPNIKELKSHFHPQSYTELFKPITTKPELSANAYGTRMKDDKGLLTDSKPIYDFLEENGAFMGGGKVGMFGMGHAIFIWGVTDTHIIYHDPAPGYGPKCRMRIDKYRDKQDGEIIYMKEGGHGRSFLGEE
jgi:hypothetical protein